MTRRSRLLSTAGAVIAVATVIIPPASAQQSAQTGIEEIVVTARKRAENLQDIPIVVTAFTALTIERKGIADLADVAKYTNGLILDEGFSKQDTRVTIRGLSPTRGRQNVAILQDDVDISSLAIGTAGGSFVINPRLIDVERIEIVKGPHSALYGRSAFNGAINYITKKPGDDVQASVQADIGTYGKEEARFSWSGPVVPDTLSIGLNGAIWTFGGYYNSSVTGADLGGTNGQGVAGSFVLTPNDMLTFTGRVEYSDDHFDPEARSMLNPNTDVQLPAAAMGAVVSTSNPLNFFLPQVTGTLGDASTFPAPGPSRNPRTGKDYPGAERDIFRANLRIDADFELATLSSITHYGDSDTFQFTDTFGVGDAASPAINGMQEIYFDTNTKLISEELRLQSNGDGPLTWTVGGLFWNEYVEQTSRSIICIAASGGCAGVIATVTGFHNPPNTTKRATYHWSGYGLAEYAITDQLKASVELRYTKEKEDTYGPASSSPSFLGCPGVGGPTARALNANGTIRCGSTAPLVTGPLVTSSYTGVAVESDFWAPRFTVDYKATEDALLYASVAMGKKPGGFSTLGSGLSNTLGNTYDPEEMWVYEAGAKTEWLDNRLQLNGAAYYQDFSKKQVSVTIVNESTGLPTTRVVNAAKARVYGFELDASAAPTEYLTINVGYTYNDAKYKKFEDLSNSTTAISRANVAKTNNCTVVATASGNRCRLDYSGNRLEGAPKHNFQVGGEVRGDVTADLSWFVDADSRYQSSRFTTFENSLKIESYWLVDMRAGLRTDTWSITGYVNNLFNDDNLKANGVYIQNWNISFVPPRTTGSLSGVSALLPDKRQFGVRVNYSF